MYIDLSFILDRSGSMQSCRQGTIEMFNGFLEGQREAVRLGQIVGKYLVSLIQFDDHYEPNYIGVSLAEAQNLNDTTYQPRGMTALLDSLGRTIHNVGVRLSSLPERERPDKVMIVTVTDGLENRSREYNHYKIGEMIKHQQDKYSWQFVFLGANQDAILTASDYGMATGGALNIQATDHGTRFAGHALCSGAVAAFATPEAYARMAVSGDVPQVNNFFLPGAKQYVNQP